MVKPPARQWLAQQLSQQPLGQYCSNKQMDMVEVYTSNGMQHPLQ